MQDIDRMILDMIENPRKHQPDVRAGSSNALRSTGPRTAEGKTASSRNSLRHGLTARTTVLPGEDQAEFDALHQGLIGDRQPEGELELQLTGEIAACLWRLARARQHEAEILEAALDLYTGSAPQLELVMRYTGSIERQLNRTIVRLEYLQTRRRKAVTAPPPEFVSQTTESKPLTMAAGAANSPLAGSDNGPATSDNRVLTPPQPAADRSDRTLGLTGPKIRDRQELAHDPRHATHA